MIAIFSTGVTTSVLVAEGGGRWTEYAGGYSDMVAQRGAGVSAAPRCFPRARGSQGEAKNRGGGSRKKRSRASASRKSMRSTLCRRGSTELRARKASLQSLPR